MLLTEIEREYPSVVVVAVSYLLDMYKSKDEIGEKEIDRAIKAVAIMNRDIIDSERILWIEKDLPFIIDGYWYTLKDKKNRGKRAEIIRGALR